MQKLSAGILVYHFDSTRELKVLLVHPGGPLWKNKDTGAWSIPKGEYAEGEDALSAAKREFKEETGNESPEGNFIPLQSVKLKSGKVVSVWAIEAAIDTPFIRSNEFEMEWPPRSGKKQFFAEVDKAEWLQLEVATIKINSGQVAFLERLTAALHEGKPKIF